jgi:hypothetical protein
LSLECLGEAILDFEAEECGVRRHEAADDAAAMEE